ncbi:MAG: 3-phosphoglycerate dehydrogenase [Gammaproteobacteria bacterium]|jgi:D-3-phosphoglycerate dehydrogenase|nr:MAG: 3-phosphoglycerate dehydrogenase [Gammaproteobacteria bacterium]HIO19115.1 hydroxyacid dehydrogenase [Gammaproteobacteria bacterium]
MKVLVVGQIHQDGINLLQARADLTIKITEAHNESDLVKLVADADAILVRSAPITSLVIDSAPNLKVVSRHGVGFNSVDVEALTARRIPLTIAVGGNAVSVAEHTLYLILALAKQGQRYDTAARQGDFNFRNAPIAREIETSQLLVIGFGRIGTQVTRRALAFGMVVHVYDPYVPDRAIQDQAAQVVRNLHDALPQMDVVSVHCPLNEKTKNLIGSHELSLMKPNALLINTARGGIVDEAALHDTLTQGGIAGAGIDVFVTEPTNPSLNLLELENVVVSPHCAGITVESSARTAWIAAQNILDGLDSRLDEAFVVNREVLNN